ncbi:hypothetical protein [Collimonas fungivorans]|uniref:hypothetical protein n=1 Tax=Collimonas fungivorans TaxID=158899 RepID=UPI003FA3B0DF
MKSLNGRTTVKILVCIGFFIFSFRNVWAKTQDSELAISTKLDRIYSQCLIETTQDRKQCQQNCGAIIKMCRDQQADFLDSKNQEMLTELGKNSACKDMSSSLSTHIYKIVEDSDNFMSNDESTSKFQIETKLFLHKSLENLKKQCISQRQN